jgi:hypothetical protein
MTFDGSPEHSRHGVGGFPKMTEQPSRTSPMSGRRILIILVTAVIALAGVVVVVLVNF